MKMPIFVLMIKNHREIFLFLSLMFCGLFINAQDARNPFELIPRLSEEAQNVNSEESKQDSIEANRNPFDLIYDSPRPSETTPYVIDTRVDPIITSDLDRFKFFSVGIVFLLLATLVSLAGSSFSKAIFSFVNDNSFNQYFREREGRGALPYYLLYILFFVSLGLFLIYLLQYYKVPLPISNLFIQWTLLSAGVAIIFFLKHLTLLIIGVIFPVQKEISRYIFLIISGSIALIVLLIPINLLMAYGPEGSQQIVLYSAFGLIALVYLFRSLRALFMANKFILFHRFHFLLYICTVELAPVFIVTKLIMNQV